MSGRAILHEAMQSPKIAAVVSAATTTTGAGTIFDWIPDDIGKLATVMGLMLSVILIRVHLKMLEKINLENEAMRAEKEERLRVAAERKVKGEPVRRDYDAN